jgi:hypothetical protein
MNPQLVLLFALLDFTMAIIAWTLLHPTMTPVPQAAPMPTMRPEPGQRRSAYDIIYIDEAWYGAGIAVHKAENNGYTFLNRSGTLRTYVRNGSATR